MASQRWTVATLAGTSAGRVAALFAGWASNADPPQVDWFSDALRDHGLELPVVYFGEWADHWLMGDHLPKPSVAGRRYEAACLSADEAVAWADRCGSQFAEQAWLAGRLREAAAVFAAGADRVVLVLRFVVGPSLSDADLRSARDDVPDWLLDFGGPGR